jgi:dextranase
VVVAAYQQVFDSAPREAAELATAFTMATLFSCGATHLLCGEADRLLVDPYYVRNHIVAPDTAAMLRRWYDYLVEYVELLQDPEAVDVTTALAGDYNGDCDVSYSGVAVTDQPVAGTMWRRIVKVGDQLVVHLVNLVGQDDTEWDAPRKRPAELSPGELRVRRGGPGTPRVRVADPDAMASLTDLEVRLDGDYLLATLPPPHVWQMVVIDL